MIRRILIINFHSGKNAGDLALLLCTIKTLKKVFENAEIKVSANWIDEPYYQSYGIEVLPSLRSILRMETRASTVLQILKFFHLYLKAFLVSLSKKNRQHVKGNEFDRLIQAFHESDLIVAVSGNQVYSSGKYGWPLPVTLAPLNFAKLFKKPLVVFPQSIGPLKRRWERWMVKKAYAHAKVVFVRDDKSLSLLRELGLPSKKFTYAPDPAFGLEPAGRFEAHEFLIRAGMRDNKQKIGLTLIPRMGRALNQENLTTYYEVLERTLLEFGQNNDVQIVLFSQVRGPVPLEDDRIPTKELYDSLKSKGLDVILIDEEVSPMMLKACYGQIDLFIASRLHSGIFAIGAGTPTLFLGYLTKTQGITTRLGLSNCFLDINEISQSKLMERINYLNDHSADVVAEIQQALQKTKSELEIIETYLKEMRWN